MLARAARRGARERHRLGRRSNHGRISSAPRPWAISPAPGLQKQPVRSEMPARLASSSTRRSSIGRPSRSCSRNVMVPPRAAVSVGPRTWTTAGRCGGGGRSARRAASGEAATRRWIASRPTRSRWSRPVVDGGQVEVVDGAVLEGGLVVVEEVAVALHRGDRDGAAGEPRAGPGRRPGRAAPAGSRRRSGSRSSCRRRATRSRAGPGATSSRLVGAKAAASSSTSHPRRAPRRPGRAGAGRRRSSTGRGRRAGCGADGSAAGEHRGHRRPVEPELGRDDRDVVDRGALAAGELADAVDRVVVVGR